MQAKKKKGILTALKKTSVNTFSSISKKLSSSSRKQQYMMPQKTGTYSDFLVVFRGDNVGLFGALPLPRLDHLVLLGLACPWDCALQSSISFLLYLSKPNSSLDYATSIMYISLKFVKVDDGLLSLINTIFRTWELAQRLDTKHSHKRYKHSIESKQLWSSPGLVIRYCSTARS